MVYAVIDTNIIVSSFITRNPSSPTRRVINSMLSGKIKPLYNDEIVDEYSRAQRGFLETQLIGQCLVELKQRGVLFGEQALHLNLVQAFQAFLYILPRGDKLRVINCHCHRQTSWIARRWIRASLLYSDSLL